ncbi:unnamed protein product [Auanema sp. JU1783]|nr:unnamed protein product [Auanema sp. JU1783]
MEGDQIWDNMNESLDSYENYDDVLLHDPLVQWTTILVAAIYILTMIIGIPANIYVLHRMRRLAKSDVERYRNGTGIALCSMSAADLCSLLLIFSQNIHQSFASESNSQIMHLTCKAMLFLTHTVTGISIWSWLLLSSLRYLAICHPLYHLRLWQMPYRALAFIIMMSILLNLWLLVAVESTPFGCTQVLLIRDSMTPNRLFHLVEMIWSFCIPLAVIVIMDTSVLIKRTSFPRWIRQKHRRKSALEEIIKLTRSTSMRLKFQHRHQKALWKWLIIALICILLNAPENIYRLVMLFSISAFTEEEDALHYSARMVAQSFYFSQFAFNAIYLSVFVYDKSTRCKTDTFPNNNSVNLPIRSRHSSHSELEIASAGSLKRLLQGDVKIARV